MRWWPARADARLAGVALALVACTPSRATSPFVYADAGGGGGTSGSDGGPAGSLSDAGGALLCDHPDCDGDGYVTPADCDDLDPRVNPEAFDFVGDDIDNDCDGVIDDPILNCETVPAALPGTPTDFARAADLCAQRSKTNAGVVFDPLIKAAWGSVSGTGGAQTFTSTTKPQQVSIVPSFGENSPRSGSTMVGLANGLWSAADPRTDPPLDPAGFHLDDACSDIPLSGLDCEALTGNTVGAAVSVQDWAELTLWVKVPSNAGSMSLDFSFFSSEFNQWWSSSANDAFFVLVSSKESAGGNVAKDAHGLAITVNSDFFQLCPVYPGPSVDDAGIQDAVALQQCVGMSGDASQSVFGALSETGYDGAGLDGGASLDVAQAVDGNYYIYGGGSGWLRTTFPVTPSEELQMRIVIMDTFDGLKDSAVLVDDLGWGLSDAGAGGVSRPPR